MQVISPSVRGEDPNRYGYGSWVSRDKEFRKLRQDYATKTNAWEAQKKRNDRLAEENERLRKRLKEQEKSHKNERGQLKEENDKLRQERDVLKGLLFKKNSKNKTNETDSDRIQFIEKKKRKKRGGQVGHKGTGYQNPDQVDEVQRLYLTNCPCCHNDLKRSDSIYTRTVQDIPDFDTIRYWVKQYEIENQWCSQCRKMSRAKPKSELPHSNYGINTLLYVLLEKYGSKSSISAIQFSLNKLFGLSISEGAIAQMLQNASGYLRSDYEQILNAIRSEPVKHCDETGWRIEGINHWVWGLFTKKHAYYAVNQSRGKGVIKDLLKGSPSDAVLIHDDYGAYQKLAAYHQSCWAHLLRESRKLSEDKNASKEVQRLNRKLKKIFVELLKITQQPFDQSKRQVKFKKYEATFQKIIQANYRKEDTQKIQTRIKNQENNLITALLCENVELTNNRAERELRPLVVTRKMSYGSQSTSGAEAHMVNMSVFRTLLLQAKDLLPSLKQAILIPAHS